MARPRTESGARVPAQQMAVRVAVISTVAFVLFGIIFFRLWYLQVLDGGKYLAEARANRVRIEPIPAPRGVIRDDDGRVIVDNRRSTSVTLDPRAVPREFRDEIAQWGQDYGRWTVRAVRAVGRRPVDEDKAASWTRRAGRAVGEAPALPRARGELWALYERLGRVLQRSPERINATVVSSLVRVPYANVTVKRDVDRAQRSYIGERQERFPGVAIRQVYVRSYPARDAAAQILGTVGEISPKQLRMRRYDGLRQGAVVGQSGLEWQYDRFLRGTDGRARIEVDAFGERQGQGQGRPPRPGRNLRLTLDLSLQRTAQQAMQTVGGGLPGAFVAFNPRSGAIKAIGSMPTYDPRELQGPFESTAEYEARFGEAAGDPVFNRAVAGLYPVGSTFKPVTALAALASGFTTVDRVYNDSGCIKTGTLETDVACNAGKVAHGPVDLVRALGVSSDTYFYDIALRMFKAGDWSLQRWARMLGFARRTGIDLPEDQPGAIPSPENSKRITEAELACRKREKKPFCGIGSGDPTFHGGEQVNFSVGQGGLQATPIQLAVAYGTIINGGAVPTPHIGRQIDDARGSVQTISPPPARHVDIDSGDRDAVMRGLFAATNGPGGTATGVFAHGWPKERLPIYGKTGTAETPKGDQSWFVGYSYRGTPERDPLVVVATVERGGFGAERAAPIVRLILSKHFGVKARVASGSSQD